MGSGSIRSSGIHRRTGENDLTRILEISHKREAALRKIGIRCFEDLARCDAERVSLELSRAGMTVGPQDVQRMRCHVQSYREERPVRCGPLPSVGDEFVVLDLEYDVHEPRIWIIGLCVVDGSDCEHTIFWAEDDESERQGLELMSDLLRTRPEAPILTWCGAKADVPQLERACRRLGLSGILDDIDERHVDLYLPARDGLRLPIPSLGLDGVATYFGTPKSSPIENGLEALNLYRRYRTRYSPRVRRQIREELIEYNRDDLDALIATARALEELQQTPEAVECGSGSSAALETLASA